MKDIKLYRIHDKFDENTLELYPRVPDRVSMNEDTTTERICACHTIMGCLRALIYPSHMDDFKKMKRINEGYDEPIYLYSSVVPVEDVYRPTVEELPDVYNTGEMWIAKPCIFTLETKLLIRKHMDIDYQFCYSRYFVRYESENNTVEDRKHSRTDTYGSYNSFSFISFNDEIANNIK
ncbi:MAG: hypothetical protein NC548_47530 [Lachnospiraceae bacterium]|nr:hypothetical protein [Lachnospiraceae bacterium]